MSIRAPLVMLAGAMATGLAGYALAEPMAADFIDRLETQSAAAIAEAGGTGVTARFASATGSLSRHPLLSGGEDLDESVRTRVAREVYDIPGVGGVTWSDGTVRAESDEPTYQPLHCQEDVEGLLRTRSIRFEEGSSALLPSSRKLLNEVADALRPCLGSIIAITGHTDKAGTEPGNLALSMERAR
ncbi:OmpA family protein, partial [Erythrobacter sp. HI0077]